MNLITIEPGDEVDAVALQHNFEELLNGINQNATINTRIDRDILPVLNQLNGTDVKNREELEELVATNKTSNEKYNTLFSGNFSKVNERPYVIEYSDKSIMPTWYRKWSNGFVEMGGIGSSFKNTSTGSGSTTIALPLVVEDVDKCVVQISGKPSSVNNDDSLWINSLTNKVDGTSVITELKVSFSGKGASDGTISVIPHWQVIGYLKDTPKEEDIVLPVEPPKEEKEEK